MITLKVHIYIFALTKCIIYCRNVAVFLYAVTMLISKIKIIIASENWFNYVLTFLKKKCEKNLDQSDDAKRRKK